MCNVFFIYGIYKRIRKHGTDFVKTIICCRQREGHWIIFTWPSANIYQFLFTIMSFYHIRQWSAQNMPWLYTVEQGKNRDRSDVCELWFLFQFLSMSFSALNFKANKNFFWSSRTLKWFLFCCFLLSCTSYVMGRMLR